MKRSQWRSTLSRVSIAVVLVAGVALPAGAAEVSVQAVDGTVRLTRSTAVSRDSDRYPIDVAMADIDHDLDYDMLMAEGVGLGGSVIIYKNDGDGGFTMSTYENWPGVMPTAVLVADFDMDGESDFVRADSTPQVVIRPGTATGDLALATPITIPMPDVVENMYLVGLDPGMQPDIVVTCQATHAAYVYLNDGSGVLGDGLGGTTAAATLAVSSAAIGAASSDFDKDGDQDLAVTSTDNRLYLFANDGTGHFSAMGSPIITPSTPHGVIARDLNGDAWADIVTANYGADSVSVFLNDHVGGFDRTDYPVGDAPHEISTFPVDLQDNKSEIITCNRDGDSVSVLRGNGDGTFSAASEFACGEYPHAMWVSDVDGDYKNDFVLAAYGEHSIEVLRNTSWPVTDRISGASRYDTAVELSKATFPDGCCNYVVVATGETFPDALAGAPLAYRLNCPILLTRSTDLPASVAAEVTRIGATSAIVLGGTNAVSSDVVDDLVAAGVTRENIERLAGKSRYDTARLIALRLDAADPGTDIDTVYVATGENFPDALAAGGIASQTYAPILLVRKDSLPVETQMAMSSLTHVSSSYIVGGTVAVSEAVMTQFPSPTRLWGSDRYATAEAIIEHAWAHNMGTFRLYMATAGNFPDALAAGPACAHRGTLLLTNPLSLPASTADLLGQAAPGAHYMHVLGGTGAVSDAVVEQMKAAY